MRRTSLGLILVALSLILYALGPASAAESPEGQWEKKRAPDFTVKDLDGKTIRLADLAGKKVVWINFWGLRCGPCVRELPALQKLYSKYASKGLLIVAVNTDGVNADFIRKAFADRPDLKAAGVTFPLVPDEQFAVIDAYGLQGAPLNVMIDRKGIVRYRHEGYEEGDEAAYAKVVERLLSE